MQYPLRPQVPNPYQIAGMAAQELGGQARQYGKDQDELSERFRLMMEKRAEAELKKQQITAEQDLKLSEDKRKQAEADQKTKAEQAKLDFLSKYQGADPTDPANAQLLKQALTSGTIDAATYKALQPKDPERFSAGGGYYEMGPDGKPKTIIPPKQDGGEKPTRGQVVTDGNGNLVIVDPVTGRSRPVTGPGGAPVLAKGSTSIPDIEAKANNSLSILDQMVGSGNPGSPDYKPPHPGFGTVVGFAGGPGNLFGLKKEPISGTDAAGFKALLDQVQGVAFLQAFQDLKGGGAITQIEGEKASNAISRLRSSLSEDEFVRAANELKEIIRAGVQRAKARGGGQPPGAPQGAEPGSVGRFKIRVKQ